MMLCERLSIPDVGKINGPAFTEPKSLPLMQRFLPPEWAFKVYNHICETETPCSAA